MARKRRERGRRRNRVTLHHKEGEAAIRENATEEQYSWEQKAGRQRPRKLGTLAQRIEKDNTNTTTNTASHEPRSKKKEHNKKCLFVLLSFWAVKSLFHFFDLRSTSTTSFKFLKSRFACDFFELIWELKI